MKFEGHLVANQGLLWPAHAWDRARGWVKAHVNRDAMVDAALTMATLGSAGFVLLTLYRIVTDFTATGF